MQKFITNTPYLHRYAFGAVLASATVLSQLNVMAFNKTEVNTNSTTKSQLLAKSQFIALDEDRDQKLSHDESSGDWDIQPHFNKADFNGNGVLEISEYVNFKNAMQLTYAADRVSNIGNGLVINGLVVKGVNVKENTNE